MVNESAAMMEENPKTCTPFWFKLIAALMVPGGIAVLIGGLLGIEQREAVGPVYDFMGPEDFETSLHFPWLTLLQGVLLIGSGAMICLRVRLAHWVFFAVGPLLAMGLAMAFEGTFWREDIPYTIVLFLLFAPICYLLATRQSLEALGEARTTWLARGGWVISVCAVVALAARIIVQIAKPTRENLTRDLFSRHHSLDELRAMPSFYETMNSYVERIAVADLFLWHYAAGLLAVGLATWLGREKRVEVKPREGV